MFEELIANWDSFSCGLPIQGWLLGTYIMILLTLIVAICSRSATNESSIALFLSCYFIVLLPFAFAWTVVGTIWFTQVSKSCLPEMFSDWVIIVILVISYLYIVIGFALCAIFGLIFWMWRNGTLQVQLAEPFIEQASRPLPQELFPRLEAFTHRFTAAEEVSCVICYEDFTTERLNTQLPCGHEMHADCLRNWLTLKAACPFCRADVVDMLDR